MDAEPRPRFVTVAGSDGPVRFDLQRLDPADRELWYRTFPDGFESVEAPALGLYSFGQICNLEGSGIPAVLTEWTQALDADPSLFTQYLDNVRKARREQGRGFRDGQARIGDGSSGHDPASSPPEEAAGPVGYTVLVDDNFHHGDADERYGAGEFVNYEEAVAACRARVEADLLHAYAPGMTADDLYKTYTAFGEDPFIPQLPPVGMPSFSAWDYARERCQVICSVEQDDSLPRG